MNKELMGKFLLQNVCCHIVIKDSLPKQASLCEHTGEVVACIVMTGKRRLGPDSWPETPNQGTDTKEMILTIWYKEAIK